MVQHRPITIERHRATRLISNDPLWTLCGLHDKRTPMNSYSMYRYMFTLRSRTTSGWSGDGSPPRLAPRTSTRLRCAPAPAPVKQARADRQPAPSRHTDPPYSNTCGQPRATHNHGIDLPPAPPGGQIGSISGGSERVAAISLHVIDSHHEVASYRSAFRV